MNVFELKEKFSRLREIRSQYEGTWSSIRDLVRPNVPDFHGSSTANTRPTIKIYDGTAPWALEQLAAGLISMNSNSADRWFSLQAPEVIPENLGREGELWLDEVASLIFHEYQKPSSGFGSSLHEAFLDLAGFGTGAQFQDYDSRTGSLMFRTYPLADCWIDENINGHVDTLFRKTVLTYRQIQQGFKLGPGSKIAQIGAKEPGRKFTIIHGVFPRSDRSMSRADARNMEYASFFFCEELDEILHEGGYSVFPYHVPRWTKLAGEVYGQSPAGNALPDIMMVNQMARTLLSAAQKASDPPVVVPNSGFLMPIRTSPGSMIFKEPGTESPEPFPYHGQPQFTLEMINYHRSQITRSFYIEHLLRERKKERQTIMEIQDERMEMMQQLGPVNGRLQTELFGPCLNRSLQLLMDNRRIPPPPFAGNLRAHYTSPAARSQMATKSIGMRRFVEEITPLANIDQTLVDSINVPELVRLSAIYEDISPKILRSDEEIEEIQRQRQESQQAQEQAGLAESMAKAAKDMSQAHRL